MAHITLAYFSQSLKKQSGLSIVYPEVRTAPLPVVYLLHGLSDDHTTWQRRTSIERHAVQAQVAVVMPDGGRGFYTDAINGLGQHEAHILEVMDLVSRDFCFRRDREGTAIGGLSMGGYGAMKLGLKHPDRFVSIAAHSSVADIAHRHAERGFPETQVIFGEEVTAEEDLFALSVGLVGTAERPALRFDCGTEDFLLEDNRRLHAHLVTVGYDHVYREYPGDHDWGYWDRHVQEALAFHRQHFTA